jgi:hypothetical protein
MRHSPVEEVVKIRASFGNSGKRRGSEIVRLSVGEEPAFLSTTTVGSQVPARAGPDTILNTYYCRTTS